jgi:small nuclear ribonucleoprotein (snRNP)-like protein
MRRQVIINTRDDQAFRGVLISKRGPLLVLANAELLEQGTPPAPILGEVVIERARVQFIQLLPAVGDER